MNSHQRRCDKRKWKYGVKTHAISYATYVDMWEWLAKKHSKKARTCGWRDRLIDVDSEYEQYRAVWEFLKERDAIEFTLRWL